LTAHIFDRFGRNDNNGLLLVSAEDSSTYQFISTCISLQQKSFRNSISDIQNLSKLGIELVGLSGTLKRGDEFKLSSILGNEIWNIRVQNSVPTNVSFQVILNDDSADLSDSTVNLLEACLKKLSNSKSRIICYLMEKKTCISFLIY
jgi:hypothetical protein